MLIVSKVKLSKSCKSPIKMLSFWWNIRKKHAIVNQYKKCNLSFVLILIIACNEKNVQTKYSIELRCYKKRKAQPLLLPYLILKSRIRQWIRNFFPSKIWRIFGLWNNRCFPVFCLVTTVIPLPFFYFTNTKSRRGSLFLATAEPHATSVLSLQGNSDIT